MARKIGEELANLERGGVGGVRKSNSSIELLSQAKSETREALDKNIRCLFETAKAENAERKDFTPTEIDAIRRALGPKVATPHGGDRKSGEIKSETFALDPGRTTDKIGAFAGVSGRMRRSN